MSEDQRGVYRGVSHWVSMMALNLHREDIFSTCEVWHFQKSEDFKLKKSLNCIEPKFAGQQLFSVVGLAMFSNLNLRHFSDTSQFQAKGSLYKTHSFTFWVNARVCYLWQVTNSGKNLYVPNQWVGQNKREGGIFGLLLENQE